MHPVALITFAKNSEFCSYFHKIGAHGSFCTTKMHFCYSKLGYYHNHSVYVCVSFSTERNQLNLADSYRK